MSSKLPVTFVVDRAGLVGRDGETHQGIFDISFMSAIPNLTMIAPKDKRELEEALEFAMVLTLLWQSDLQEAVPI